MANKVIASLSESLVAQYGQSFEARNLRRTMQFAQMFPALEIVTPLVSKLSWTHFMLMLADDATRQFYARQAIDRMWSKRELISQIELKTFERSGIADSKLGSAAAPDVPEALAGSSKDTYFLEHIGRPDRYLEHDLEHALTRELEHFMLELDKGLAFAERKKRRMFDREDFYLDLRFYHRRLRRLVDVDAKRITADGIQRNLQVTATT